MKSTLLALSVILLGCDIDPYGITPANTQPDTQAVSAPDTSLPKTDTQSSSMTVTSTDTHTVSETVTTTSVTTKTETTPDAGTPDSLPPQITPDALVQVAQPDALPVAQDTLPAAQDTLPQVTPDTLPAQQPDALPMTVDAKPATPDTMVLVDTKPATPDVLPAIDTKPAEDSKPVTTDTLTTAPDTVPAGKACGGDGQSCCITQAVDRADAWIHTCVDSVKGTFDCTINLSIGTTPGPSGTCMTCGYRGYPGCTHLNLGMFSWKWGDIPGAFCDHDYNQIPVYSGDVGVCP